MKPGYRAEAPTPYNKPGVAGMTSSYMRGEGSPLMWAWTPLLRDPVDEVGLAWGRAAARMTDALANSGWLFGGLNTAVSQMVGSGLSLEPQPDPLLFGGDAIAARKWGQDIASRFQAWANDALSCDLGGRFPLGQLTAQGVRQYFATGEILATLPYREIDRRPGSTHGTKVNVLPSSRLAAGGRNPRNVQGVILGEDGLAEAYNLTTRDIATNDTEEVEVQARDVNGRPVVVHVFDGEPTQVRGITPLTSVLNPIRQYDQLANATLTSALVQTIIAGAFTSDQPTEDLINALSTPEEQDAGDQEEGEATPGGLAQLLQLKGEWYSKTKIDMGQFGKFLHLFPGEQLQLLRAESPNTGYEPLTKGLLREVARCFGLTYESFTGDYVGATYSSVRMSTADCWLLNLYRRQFIPARFNQMVYESWLEEELELFPELLPAGNGTFYQMRNRLARALWRGPPKPEADAEKAAMAQVIQKAQRWVTQAQLCAEYGNNWLDNHEAAEQVAKDEKDRGLAPTPLSVRGGGGGGGSKGDGKGDGGGDFGSEDGGEDRPVDEEERRASLGYRLDRALKSRDPEEIWEVMPEVETRVAEVAARFPRAGA